MRQREWRQDIDMVVRFYRENDVDVLEMANALRVAALAEDACQNHDAARALWDEARDLYAQEGVEAGVLECERRLGTVAVNKLGACIEFW